MTDVLLFNSLKYVIYINLYLMTEVSSCINVSLCSIS